MQKILIIGIAVVVFVGGTVAWKSAQSDQTNTPVVVSTQSIAVQPLEARIAPDGWREYRTDTYGFSVLYPQELAVGEHPEGGGAMTITLQNPDKGEGLQIFIVPYGESKVSEARFRQDIPSGVRTGLVDITVDGATGAAFYSKDEFLGDTREVWFVHGGYLFEVTTLKLLNDWLAKIMKTWKFI